VAARRFIFALMSDLICSAKGCRQEAVWALLWNNPKLHDADRRKTWLACGDHRESLGSFLSARGFLREVQSLSAPETSTNVNPT
jgi:hypothetical protein